MAALSVAQDAFGVAPEADYRMIALAAMGPRSGRQAAGDDLFLPQVQVGRLVCAFAAGQPARLLDDDRAGPAHLGILGPPGWVMPC